jgi:hypothetical protein
LSKLFAIPIFAFSYLVANSAHADISCAIAERAYPKQVKIDEALDTKFIQSVQKQQLLIRVCEADPSQSNLDKLNSATAALTELSYIYESNLNYETALLNTITYCNGGAGSGEYCRYVALRGLVCD